MGLIVGSRHGQELLLPLKEKSVRFAVMGDSGTGKKGQYEVAQRMVEYQQRFPFEFVIMLGDNIYGTNSPSAYTKKFELPYKPLLEGGVKFYAALGNHDNPDQRLTSCSTCKTGITPTPKGTSDSLFWTVNIWIRSS
jgi:hypothetical protein